MKKIILCSLLMITAISHGAQAQSAVSQSCIVHRTYQSLSEIGVEATNRCDRPVLANICAALSGRIGFEREGKRVEPARTVRFSYFVQNDTKMRYRLAECAPGETTRQDLCVPQCPQAFPPSSSKQSKPPEPMSSPASWVMSDDYPAASMRADEQGTVHFKLTVGPNGRPSNCTVTRSSGYALLDQATCTVMMRRGRFHPATNDKGVPVSGTWSDELNWRMAL